MYLYLIDNMYVSTKPVREFAYYMAGKVFTRRLPSWNGGAGNTVKGSPGKKRRREEGEKRKRRIVMSRHEK